MSEVSNLKLKLNSMEKDRVDFDDRFRDNEVCEIILRTGILFVSACVLSLLPKYTHTHTHTHTHTFTFPLTPNKHSFMLSDTCVGEGRLILLSVSEQLFDE